MWPTEFTDVLLNPYKIIKHDSKNQHKSCNFDMSKIKLTLVLSLVITRLEFMFIDKAYIISILI